MSGDGVGRQQQQGRRCQGEMEEECYKEEDQPIGERDYNPIIIIICFIVINYI